MPTVPPGNKNIGELSSVSVVGTVKTSLVKALQLQQGVLVAPTTPPSVSAPANKLLGELTSVLTIGAKNKTILVRQVQGAAVVFYSPPTTITNYQLQGGAVVDPVTKPATAPTDNKFVGELTTIGVFGLVNQRLSIMQVQGAAVVQQYQPRKELTTFNVDYAADAKFNLTPAS